MRSAVALLLASALALGACAASPTAQQPSVEAAFSPEAGAQALVLKTIGEARQSIRLAAYAFTSPAVVRALIAAHRRGVDVQIVADDKHNRSKSGRAALNLVVNAGIPTRTVSAYAIHHDKFIVADGATVQTGSFNYTAGAARSNSENVLVIRDNPQLAAQYLNHWLSRWDQGMEWKTEY